MRLCAGFVFLISICGPLAGQTTLSAAESNPAIPGAQKERFTYDVEWKLIHAGTAVWNQDGTRGELKLDSAGMVSALFKVNDVYEAAFDRSFCAIASTMDSQEGKRHRETTVKYDGHEGLATFVERDLVKNATLRRAQVRIPSCVHEILGALLILRNMELALGKSAQIAVSDGRKSASVKVEGQMKETLKTPLGSYQTIRYEANLLNGVVYSRKGRALIWLTDDARRIPVQIQLRLQFPIGTVTLRLVKEGNL